MSYVIDSNELKNLLKSRTNLCVSLSMPMFTSGKENEQNRTRFKNHLRKIERYLIDRKMKPHDIHELISPGYDLLREETFWTNQLNGLIVYMSVDYYRMYKVPYEVKEHSIVDLAFYIVPLLPSIVSKMKYMLLEISERKCHLFECDEYDINEIDISMVIPADIDETLQYDNPEKQLQYHTKTQSHGNIRPAIYHNHGQGTDDAIKNENVNRYLHAVHEGVMKVIKDKTEPLILVGLDHEVGMYKKINKYHYLNDEFIPVNPKEKDIKLLNESARQILRPKRDAEIKKINDKYALYKKNSKINDETKDILSSAINARVETLLIEKKYQLWNGTNLKTDGIEEHSMLNHMVLEVLKNSGSVYVLNNSEMPVTKPVVALLRY